MRKILVFLFSMAFCFKGITQQIIPMQKSTAMKTKGVLKKIANKDQYGHHINVLRDPDGTIPDSITIEQNKENQKIFGVFGVGNLNKEQLEKFNASGKFSCYIRPLIKDNSNLTFYLSFNKNATNNDSLLASTLIFPEIGNNSFLGTVEYSFLANGKNPKPNQEHFIVPFFEFSNKNIMASLDTANAKSQAYHFSTLNYTVGLKYLFHYSKTIEKEDNNVYFSLSGYASYLNIPNQDTADYRILLKSKTISDNLWSIGLKAGVQYNNFSIFADFRHVLGTDKRIPVRELRGFNSNIGVVFNAEIFGL